MKFEKWNEMGIEKRITGTQKGNNWDIIEERSG